LPLLGHKAAAKVVIFLFTVYGLQFTGDYFYGLLTVDMSVYKKASPF
jgi:hypothetical protein